jgi:lipoate-protein ligase A
METWRFIDSGPCTGAFNMAMDVALVSGLSDSPTLRLYAWRPWAISLGFHQKADDLDFEKCVYAGIDVVRRPTGGKAILHAEEITYCVSVPKKHRLYRLRPLNVYNQISLALIEGLNSLGLGVTLERQNSQAPNYRGQFACFESSAKYEIQHNGKKVVGSAQRRFKHGLLQHGSILTSNAHLRLANYVIGTKTLANGIGETSTDLHAISGRVVSWTALTGALRLGFRNVLNIRFTDKPLSSSELGTINQQSVFYQLSGGIQICESIQ